MTVLDADEILGEGFLSLAENTKDAFRATGKA
jgi:hypothetical protein